MSTSTDASLLEQGNNGDSAPTTTDVPRKPTWTDQFKGDLRNDEAFNDFPTITDFGNAYKEMRGKLENAVVKPGKDATDEEVAAYLNSLGRPETPDGYEFALPDDIPAEARLQPEYIAEVAKDLHSKGFTQEQANYAITELQGLVLDGLKSYADQAEKVKKEADAKLAEVFGSERKEKTAIALKAVDTFFGKSFRTFLNDTGLADNADLIIGLYKIGTAISSNSIMDPSEKGTAGMRRTESGLPLPKGMFPSMEGKKTK